MNSLKPMAQKKSQVEQIREVGGVFMTYDYTMFSSISGNRNVNSLHLKRLIESMKEEYLISPIIVNEQYQVIDGQHRLSACIVNELPVYFIVAEGYGLNQIHRLNTNSKDWTSSDYAIGYAGMGLNDYSEYIKFKKQYGFGHNETIMILCDKVSEISNREKFINGEFKIGDIKKAHLIASRINDFAEYYAGYRRRTFVLALISLFKNKNYDHDHFLQKLKVNPGALFDCTNTSNYIDLIEDIYNYRSRNKVSLKY